MLAHLLSLSACTSDEPAAVPDGLTDTSTPPVVTPPPTVPPPAGPPALVFTGDRPKNVLMISVDTFRRDHFSRYDPAARDLTPFLAGLAADGVALDAHQQIANWTLPAVTTTLLGRFGWEVGFLPDTSPLGLLVPDSDDFLAVQLAQAGFATVLRTGNKFLDEKYNNVQGYTDAAHGSGGADGILHMGMDALDQVLAAPVPPERWLLHVHLMEPHAPYAPPVRYLEAEAALPPVPYDLADSDQTDLAAAEYPTMTPEDQQLLLDHLTIRYAGEIHYLDDQVAQVWDELDTGGYLDDTLVVFWTDHGEQLGERGYLLHANHLGPEENDGIAFFWAKNLAPVAWDGPTSTVDLVPTVLDALGLPADPDHSGRIVGTAPADRVVLGGTISRLETGMSCGTRDGWKLVYEWGTGALQLYDRNTDPGERTDRFAPTEPHAVDLWPEVWAAATAGNAANPAYPLVPPPVLPAR